MTKREHCVGHHHIVPRARGGYDQYWNSFSWGSPSERARKHVAWHALFIAMLPSQAIDQIDDWTGSRDGFSVTSQQRVYLKACFGKKVTPETAKEWIRKNFLPAEKKWRRYLQHSWSDLFGNMNPGEAKDYIRKRWMGKKGTKKFLRIWEVEYTGSDTPEYKKIREAWQNLFGQRRTMPQKALTVIDDRYQSMIRESP